MLLHYNLQHNMLPKLIKKIFIKKTSNKLLARLQIKFWYNSQKKHCQLTHLISGFPHRTGGAIAPTYGYSQRMNHNAFILTNFKARKLRRPGQADT